MPKPTFRKIIAAASIIAIFIILLFYFNTKRATEIPDIKTYNIDKIEIIDMSNRSKTTIVADKDKISEFMKQLDKYIVAKNRFLEKSGYNYVFKLEMEIYNGDSININGKEYYIVKNGMSNEEIQAFLKK
ncbi:hypothetical protein IAI10_09335 [Clostridium sp. 19966]|uniref:hypothetical protein n=1 Tax=Clostridium sp. 19966 TaxID=2768166 RepID=UPI0028DD5478|nr:hypothetical protein [Clostridium sp. 19966]MDT8716860.1 hypothetical protein [Clostridium sp. 19966]